MLEKEKQERKQGDIILGMMFVIFILVCNLGNYILADQEKSQEENRSLAQKPELDKQSMIRGSFMDQYEDYLSDQFIGRDAFREFNIFVKMVGGSRMESDVFLGEGGQLLKNITKPDQKMLDANIEAINLLAQEVVGKNAEDKEGVENQAAQIQVVENQAAEEQENDDQEVENQETRRVFMLLVPDCTEIYQELLPEFATVESEKEWFDTIENRISDDIIWIDGLSIMSKYKKEKLYYRTDHHWTTLGAYHMFCECKNILGVSDKTDESGDQEEASEEQAVENAKKSENEKQYEVYPITTDFNGMLSGNSGFCPNEREEIDVYIPKEGAVSVILNYVDQQKRKTSLYDRYMLEEKDKYSVFLGGNSSLIDIRTTSTSEKKILLIKDSFANCFIPFLTEYYSEIVVVDPRYYSGTIHDVMDTYPVDDILFLYSGATFLNDNNIKGFIMD